MASKIKSVLDLVDEIANPRQNRSTIRGAKRKAFPKVYDDPRSIAKVAAARSAPETEAMKELFGVTRDELYDLTKQTRGLGGESVFQPPAKSRGADSAKAVMQNQNKQRLIDTLAEAGKYPEIYKGMDSWYNLDPMYNIMVDLFGEAEANRRFLQLNSLSGMSSPMADVLTETGRGTAANWMINQGKFDDFVKYGGQVAGRPEYMGNFPGHLAHKTAQLPAMKKYVETGDVQMASPKVPVYINASTPESLGGSWRVPVGDAHWSRAVGLADTRNMVKGKDGLKIPGQSVSNPELADLTPWWAEISDAVGLESVPAQARLWGTASHATGVQSPIGASKLELIANKIMAQAKKRGIDPKLFRDYVLAGGDVKKLGLSAATVASLAGVPAFAQDQESPQERASSQDALDVSMEGIKTSSKSPSQFAGMTFETAISMLRGMGVGLLDAIQMVTDEMIPESSILPSGKEKPKLPNYDPKYVPKKDQDFIEGIGLFSLPTPYGI